MEHWSDCAVNNGPALEPGPCDCGGFDPSRGRELRDLVAPLAGDKGSGSPSDGIAGIAADHPLTQI